MKVTDQYLLEHHIKPSVQRVAIMDYLKANRTHPTVDEVYNALLPSVPTLSKTTVYNTLKLFAEQGAALCISIEEKNVRFDADIEDHAHFICLKCNKIYDIPMKSKAIQIVTADDFSITQTHLYYKGYCQECKDKK